MTLQKLFPILALFCFTLFSCKEDFLITKPKVEISSIEMADGNIVLNGQVTDAGKGNIARTGFIMGEDENFGTDGTYFTNIKGDVIFAETIEDFDFGRTYYFKAFAQNEEGDGFSAVQSYTPGN